MAAQEQATRERRGQSVAPFTSIELTKIVFRAGAENRPCLPPGRDALHIRRGVDEMPALADSEDARSVPAAPWREVANTVSGEPSGLLEPPEGAEEPGRPGLFVAERGSAAAELLFQRDDVSGGKWRQPHWRSRLPGPRR